MRKTITICDICGVECHRATDARICILVAPNHGGRIAHVELKITKTADNLKGDNMQPVRNVCQPCKNEIEEWAGRHACAKAGLIVTKPPPVTFHPEHNIGNPKIG